MIENKLFIFDLDGVLLNSEPNMKYAWAETIKNNNYKINFSEYKKHIGLPFKKILRNLNIKSKDFNKIQSDYSKYSILYHNKIKLFPNTLKTINAIKKKNTITIFTSKDRKRTIYFLKKFKLKFNYIISGDDVKKGKPNPEGLLKIKKKYKANKNDIFYIGDTSFDFKAAKKGKINYIHANWGVEKFYKKKKYHNIKIIKNIRELLKI